MTDVRSCEVCGKIAELQVRSSPIAPVSFGYCGECLERGLEPYTSLVGLVLCVPLEDLNEQVADLVVYNLKEQSISIEQFIRDVQEAEESFYEWCETQMEV